MTAQCGEASAMMGDALAAPAGSQVAFAVRVQGLAGARLDIVMDGRHGAALTEAVIKSEDAALGFTLLADVARHWIRADVRSADGTKTLVIGNPIYLNAEDVW